MEVHREDWRQMLKTWQSLAETGNLSPEKKKVTQSFECVFNYCTMACSLYLVSVIVIIARLTQTYTQLGCDDFCTVTLTQFEFHQLINHSRRVK